MAVIVGPPENVIRCRSITEELRELLNGAADATGVDRVVIVSGGQTSNHAPHLKGAVCGWTGSRRHDNGRAADIELVRGGETLMFSDSDGSQVADFVSACAATGATGIGAGVNYMGRKRIHVGWGNSPSDLQKLVWGAAGASANAPAWLRAAAQKGWNSPVHEETRAAPEVASHGSRRVVMARGGLWLRKGPGLGFDRSSLLAEGTELSVVGLDGEWARVDLQGDGRIDGHVFAAFLGAVDSGDLEDAAEEPAEDAAAHAEDGDGEDRRGKRGRGSQPARERQSPE